MAEALARLEVDELETTLQEVQSLLAGDPAGGALRARLDALHPADIAFILEALPHEERLAVWDLVKADRDGEILVEVSEAVRESLIEAMDSQELVAAAETLEADELADIAADLPAGVMEEVVQSLPAEERERLRAALSYPEGSVGSLMDFEHVAVREDVTLEAVTRFLRRLDELTDHTDQLFVVDRAQRLKGALPLARLIVSDLDLEVARVMVADSVRLSPEDPAEDAANVFERYDLVSAPVVDEAGSLIGRLTVDAVVDYIREKSAESRLAEAGLREEEDVFAPVLDSFKNRWAWLAINLVTAFIASRVIGLFEGSIERLVALAALMPIVAGIGGNSGNQTITMIVRALALNQITAESAKRLWRKELTVSLLNGLIWGGVIGIVAWLLYDSLSLGLVMTAAMTLNLLLAAFAGVGIPVLMTKFGRDPALGSSVLITAMTDSGGFFIFLGLATIFLM
jgi:magnesium transporter